MKSFKARLLLILFSIWQFSSIAQEPSIKKIGDSELSGINIFDIIQDSERYYWLATNMGLYKYDGYAFKKIDIENNLSASAFSIKNDKNHRLYFKNLSGQIFIVKNDSCFLYYEVPDSLKSRYFNYAFDNQNNLIIAAKQLFYVKDNQQIEIISKGKTTTFYNSFRQLKDGTIIIPEYSNNELFVLKDGVPESWSLRPEDKEITTFFLLGNIPHFTWRNQVFRIDLESKGKITTTEHQLNHKPGTYKFYDNDSLLIVPNLAGGAYFYDKWFNPIFDRLILQNHIISCGLVDQDNNLILGTFGEGLILIPNMNLKTIKLPDENLKPTEIETGENGVFLGFINGRIFRYNNQNDFKPFLKNEPADILKRVELLEHLPSQKKLIVDRTPPVLVDIRSKQTKPLFLGAIKDIEMVTANKYIASSNQGVYFLTFTSGQGKAEFKSAEINNFKLRSHCANQDTITQTIYAGTASGLKIGSNSSASLYKINGKHIQCRDIVFHRNSMYIATQKHGILIFNNDKLIDRWNKTDGLISNRLKQIKFYQNKVYLSTYDGLQVLDENGNSLAILNSSVGLSDNNVLDFDILNDTLWVLMVNKIQTISINKLLDGNTFTPQIKLEGILVNGSAISLAHQQNFSHRQNKFAFQLSSISIKFQKEIKYHFKLENIDEKWQVNNYYEPKIEYKTLPSGDYVFKAKASCRNMESDLVTYAFSIHPPFWEKWWFYLLITVVFIGVTILIYRFQLQRQRRKIKIQNELNAAKLIAIQSQMNPHFIFNAINSIQDLILQGDIDNSYDYVIKFSKLVRKTLDYSDKDFIEIESEIELLETYLELEKLRFSRDFEYSIDLNGVENILVPPMMVQPFVENAIKHGLLHKSGPKKVNIAFHKKETLVCSVEDNGIGRSKAQAIKDRDPREHQSFSVNATQNRFEIMKSHYKFDLSINYIDSDEGTKVIINMPYKKHY